MASGRSSSVSFALPSEDASVSGRVAAWINDSDSVRGSTSEIDDTEQNIRSSNIPRWKAALNDVFHRRLRSSRRVKLRSPTRSLDSDLAASAISSGSTFRIDSPELTNDSDSDSVSAGSGSVLKRSEEITSELDISRRTDLDEDTLEKWWVKQSTQAHKRMVLLLLLMVVFATAHFVAGVGWLLTPAPQQNAYLCDSAACKVVASDLLAKMNEVIDPCNDFFLFTCGKQWESSMAQKGNEPDDDWALVTAGQIYYDFSSSQTIGKMLRQNDPWVLPFHKTCMDIQRRNTEKLDPYFWLLKFHGIHEAEKHCTNIQRLKTKPYCDLPRAFSKVNDLLIPKLVTLYINKEQSYFIATLKNDSIPHSIFTFGFDTYLSVVKNALTYLSDLGSRSKDYKTTWGDAASIDAYAKLFICAELNLLPYSENGEVGPPLWARNDATGKLSELCNYRVPTGTLDMKFPTEIVTVRALKWSDFLKDQNIYNKVASKNPEETAFPFEEILNLVIGPWFPRAWYYQLLLPDSLFIALDLLFADYNMMVRFLQWSLLKQYGHTLDETLDKIFWPITRDVYLCDWIATCISTMFEKMPNRAQELYMQTVPPEDAQYMETLVGGFPPVIDQLRSKFNFPQLAGFELAGSEEQRRNLSKMALNAIELQWPKKFFDSKVSPPSYLRYLKLEDSHFLNVAKLQDFREVHEKLLLLGFESHVQWELNSFTKHATINRPLVKEGPGGRKMLGNPDFEHQTSFSVIDYLYSNNRAIPIGTFELPYFGTKFPALDVGGIGRYSMRKVIEFATGEGMFLAMISTPGINTSTIENYFDEKLKKVMEFAQKSDPSLWKVPGKPEMYNTLTKDVNNLYSDQLSLQMACKLTYDLHEQIILKNPIAEKMVLPGLEKYNARKLLFIQSAARSCEDYSVNRLKHMKNYGPIPNPISVNLAAANSKEFSKVFQCPVGSRMNPAKKFNFYDD